MRGQDTWGGHDGGQAGVVGELGLRVDAAAVVPV